MYPGVELRLQRYAVILAEELNFTRAAKRLHVAQPALSRSIRQLEDFLGFELFLRSSRQVEVTAAGRAFVEHARLSVQHAEQAILSARSIHKKEEAVVTFGRSPYVDPQIVSELLHLSRASHPPLELELSSAFTMDLVARLQMRTLQLALLVLPIIQQDIACHVISREQFFIGMHSGHRLARAKRLKPEDLDGEAILLPSRSLNPVFFDWIEEGFKKVGVSPQLLDQIMVPEEAFHLALEEYGLCLLSQHEIVNKSNLGLVFRPMDGFVFETALAWQSEETSEVILDFVNGALRRFSQPNVNRLRKLTG